MRSAISGAPVSSSPGPIRTSSRAGPSTSMAGKRPMTCSDGTTTEGSSMNVEDLIFVSVDDHVVEPPTMFDGLLPARFVDEGPRFVPLDDSMRQWPGDGHWVVGDQASDRILNYEVMRPSTWDPAARVREFNSVGILGSLGFPTFPQFCGQLFSRLSDKELALATIRAYNDWQADVWAGSHPDRFIPLALVPLWDPVL